ncbi:MAG: transcriptional regulator [Flavobacteriaceae bacterium]|nr:MAG: transcriptional regulator [Flavobacteriaceae bacterium]
MISTSSKYAIKGVLFLAMHSSEAKKIMVKDICTPINVPQAYLAKLLQELSRQKIISSTRGPKGGFYLSDENRSQPLIKIVHAIDGQRRMNACVLSLKTCDENRPCPLHKLVSPAKKQFIKSLKEKTIENLANNIANGISFLPL